MKWLVIILGVLLLVGSANATSSYESLYPPVHNATYVKATSVFSTDHYPYLSTDPAKSLVGIQTGNQWYSTTTASQRFHIDLGTANTITKVYYENSHNSGISTTRGVRNFTFWGSNSSESFSNVTYTNNTGWVQLTTSSSSFNQHTASNVTDPYYINVTNTGAYRYYAFKFDNNWGDGTMMGVRRIELQKEIYWAYSTPGTYYWVCPPDVTSVYSMVGGGGGGGKSGAPYVSMGYGGAAGGWSSYAGLAVTPGINYTIVVGAGGAASAVSAVSNAGSQSSAFSHISLGGSGGLQTPNVQNHNGGAGSNGFLTGGNAAAGGATSSYAGGTAGTGYSAGGGGGAEQYSGGEGGTGGKGSDGYVGIFQTGYSTYNVPDFTGSPVIGIPGTLVHFTDESSLVDSNNITYLWDFGDGSTSTTMGDISHVFPYTGSYTVSLTISSDGGVAVTTKEAYINLISEVQQLDLKTEPNPVQFTLVNKYGNYLKNVAVTAKMTSSSSNNTNWFQTIFGISSDATSVNETTMSDITGDDGAVAFPMVSAALYHITFTNVTQGVSDSKDIHPTQSNYIYILSSTGTATAANMADSINITLWTYPAASTNPATIYLIANYTDASATTSNATFFVNFSSNNTIKYTYSTTSSPLNAQYGVTNTAGVGYTWAVRGTTTTFGNVSKAMGLTLKGTGQYGLASNLLSVCNNWECT